MSFSPGGAVLRKLSKCVESRLAYEVAVSGSSNDSSRRLPYVLTALLMWADASVDGSGDEETVESATIENSLSNGMSEELRKRSEVVGRFQEEMHTLGK